MGIRNRYNLQCHCVRVDYVVHGRNVSGLNIAYFGSPIIKQHPFRLYDRHLKTQPPRSTGLRYRIETLVGITGSRLSNYRSSWQSVIFAPFRIVWRPHLLAILVFEALVFGFSIGINVTNAVFLGSPPPVGYGFSQFGIAGAYGTPIVRALSLRLALRHC